MASKVSGIIEQIKVDNGNKQAIASTAYGYCTTTASDPNKTVDMSGFYLLEGVTIHVQFQYDNTIQTPTLNIENTGAKEIEFGNANIDKSNNIIGWRAGDIVAFTYDASHEQWIMNTSAYAIQAGNILSGNISPIMSKTYTGVTVTGNNDPAGWLYFFKACCTSAYNDVWRLTYKVTASCPGQAECNAISIVHIDGVRNTYVSYWVWNSIGHTSYYPFYAHAAYWRSDNNTNAENQYAPILGLRFQSCYKPTDASYGKTITFDIIEMKNCQVTFFNNGMLYSAVPGTGSTYFSSRSSFNGTTQGISMTGDRNDTAQYVSTNGFKGQVGENKIGRYTLFLKTSDGKYESIVQQVNTTAATKTPNPHGFLPEGKIYYNSNSSDYNAGILNFNPYEQYHAVDYRYSFNLTNTTLPDYCETYLKYTYDSSTGLLYLAEDWLATALPTSEDGFIYQRIGSKYYTGTSNYYQGSVLLNNPYYEYSNSSLHTWSSYATYAGTASHASDADTINGLTVETAVPENAVFTDHYDWGDITSKPTTLTGYGIAAGYGDTISPYGNKNANTILAGPSSGNAATPAFRKLVDADLPDLGNTYVKKSSELLTTNSFAPASLKGPYISKIDNAFYAADKRWTVNGTNISNIANLFDGNYESTGNITAGKTSVITIDFDPNHNNSAYFPGYPYGYILVSFYYTSGPSSVSGRVYCNYDATGHGVGWHNISFSPMSDNTNQAIVYRSAHQGYYNISQLEITIITGTAEAKITQIEMHLDRPRSDLTPFLSKYNAETLYYNLTAPKFIGPLQGNADTATKFNSTRKIELTGAVTGSATTDGSSGWTIATTVNHGHGNITSDGKSTSNSITGSNVEVTTGHKFLREDGTWVVPAYTTNTNTHRPIKVNGTQILGDNTTALNLKAGNNITITATANQSDITIAATDTTYSTFVKSGSTHASGLVPDPGSTEGTIKFLREDASWQTAVTSVTISAGVGITVSSSDAITTTGTRIISITNMDTTNGNASLWLNQKGGWTAPPNNAVTQTANTENKEFSILLKNSNNTTSPETAGVKFANTTNKLVTVNPSTGNISAYSFNKLTLTEATTGFTISGGNTTSRTLTVTNDYTLGAACAKSVDTDTMTSSSTNLPTAKAVAAYITSQGFLTAQTQNTAVLYATSENGTSHSASLSDPYLRLIDGTSGSNVQLEGGGMTTVRAVNGKITINTPQVTASTLGLEAALRFKGTTSTNISLAANRNNSTITIDGTPYTAIVGDVVLYDDGEYGDGEYLWTDDGWEELGHASAFKKIQTNIQNNEGEAAVNEQQVELEGNKFIYSFSQNPEGVVSVLTRKVPTYTHPTGNGNQHLPAATSGETGYYLRCADASTGAGEWHALTIEDIGATSVTLNGVDYSGAIATFYAPLSYGSAGSPLIGAGANNAPIWHNGLTLSGVSASDYSATFFGTTNSTSKDTGSVLISGGLGVTYNVSAAKYIVDDHVTLQWNSTDQSLDFIFA